jgi:hypothetical protein
MAMRSSVALSAKFSIQLAKLPVVLSLKRKSASQSAVFSSCRAAIGWMELSKNELHSRNRSHVQKLKQSHQYIADSENDCNIRFSTLFGTHSSPTYLHRGINGRWRTQFCQA